MPTASRRLPALLAVICAVTLTAALGACSPGGSSAQDSTPTPTATATTPASDRFVITWAKDSEAAKLVSSVENYGVDIISSLPQEDQDAIKTAAEQASVSVKAATAHAGGLTAVRLSEVLPSEKAQAFIQALLSYDSIEAAEPEVTMTALSTSASPPDDEYFDKQWALTSDDRGLNVVEAWGQSTGKDVTVAVVDSGILPDHPDIKSQLLPGYDFLSDPWAGGDNDGRDADPTDMGDAVEAGECGNDNEATDSSWHGSHVAGIIAASTNNGTGVAGVAPDAKIVPVRALGRCGGGADIVDAITWASGGSVNGVPDNENPAQVINLSLGGPDICPVYFQRTIDEAVARGSIIVAAAGNEDQDAGFVSPAGCENVITVGASNASGDRAVYSNYGSTVDVTAPGGDLTTDDGVLSLFQHPSSGEPAYTFMQGTSQASPHVAGVVALMLSIKPDLTAEQVTETLTSTSQSMHSCDRDACGAGIINAKAAVEQVASDQVPAPGDGQATEEPSDDASKPGLRETIKDLWNRITTDDE